MRCPQAFTSKLSGAGTSTEGTPLVAVARAERTAGKPVLLLFVVSALYAGKQTKSSSKCIHEELLRGLARIEYRST